VEGLEAVFDRLEALELVVAVGLIGDWVVLSLGDSTDHLQKLAITNGKPATGGSLLDQKPFAPLLAHKDRKITSINYVSGELMAAISAAADDFDPLLESLPNAAEAAGYPAANNPEIVRVNGFFDVFRPQPFKLVLVLTYLVILVTMFFSYAVASAFMSVFDLAVDSVLICYITDIEENAKRGGARVQAVARRRQHLPLLATQLPAAAGEPCSDGGRHFHRRRP
jgi:hypothetical protein